MRTTEIARLRFKHRASEKPAVAGLEAAPLALSGTRLRRSHLSPFAFNPGEKDEAGKQVL